MHVNVNIPLIVVLFGLTTDITVYQKQETNCIIKVRFKLIGRFVGFSLGSEVNISLDVEVRFRTMTHL